MLPKFWSSCITHVLSACKLIKSPCSLLQRSKFILFSAKMYRWLLEFNILSLVPWGCSNAPRELTVQRENHWSNAREREIAPYFISEDSKSWLLKFILFYFLFSLCQSCLVFQDLFSLEVHFQTVSWWCSSYETLVKFWALMWILMFQTWVSFKRDC